MSIENSAPDTTSDERQRVIDTLANYFVDVLETPRAEFCQLSPCPFVKKERELNKIRYDICEVSGTVPIGEHVRRLRDFANDTVFSTLLLVDPVKQVSVEQCVAYGVELTRRVIDCRMIAIGLHPDDDFEIGGFRPRRIPYVTLLCQSIDVLADAKRRLAKTAYYEKWSRAALEFNGKQIGRFLTNSDRD